MTLIQYMAVGSVVVGMCSDTRQIVSGNLFGFEFKIRHDDSEDKTGHLTDYVLFGGGGLNSPVERVKELILEHSGGAQTLDGIVPAFKKAIEEMRQEKEYKTYVNKNECFQVLIVGFTNDGHTGCAKFSSGKDAEVDYKIHEYYGNDVFVIAPSDDETEIVNGYLEDIEKPLFPEQFPESMVGYFVSAQKACFLNDERNVSETSVYTVIYRDPNTHEFKFYKGTINLLEGDME